MKRFFAFMLVVVGCLSLVESTAQSRRVITPFTPSIRDTVKQEWGTEIKKNYIHPQPLAPRMNLTLSYGYMSRTTLNSVSERNLKIVYGAAGRDASKEVQRSTGVWGIGIGWEINPWLELTIPFYFTRNTGYASYTTPSGNVASGEFTDDWYLLMPSLRVNWMRASWVSVYTKAGVGLGLGNCTANLIGKNVEAAFVFPWQISPLGVEFSTNHFAVYVEGGYGYTGQVMAGMKFRFGPKMGKRPWPAFFNY